MSEVSSHLGSSLSQSAFDTIRHQQVVPIRAIYAVIMMLCFATVQAFVLSYGHLAEDAFILFEYVNHFNAGLGISYNGDGQPVEGATDFLWFMLISLLGFAGVTPPVAASALNTLGFGLIGWVIADTLAKGQKEPFDNNIAPQWSTQSRIGKGLAKSQLHLKVQYLGWLGFLCILLFSHFTFAAYAGFSTALYAGMILLGLKRLKDQDDKSFRDLPLLAITIGLFRPDGVLIGVTMVFLKGFFAFKTSRTKPFLTWSIVALAIGVGYFLWRMTYFSELLPLPLYVKSDSSATFAGFQANIEWLHENIHWFILTATFVIMTKSWRYIYLLLPGLILFAALTTSTQTQNVGYRFQAPLFVSFIFLLALMWHRISWRFAQPTTLIAMIAGLHLFMCMDDLPKKIFHQIGQHNYVSAFAKLIDPYVDASTTLAVTEAGRLAYYNDATVIDLVGLNTPALAKVPVTKDYIDDLAPDIMFLYHDRTLASDNLGLAQIVPVSHSKFQSMVLKHKLYAFDNARREREIQAASSAVEFLAEKGDEYELFLIFMPEVQTHRHVLAVKKSFENKEDIIKALHLSHKKPSDYFSVMAL